MTLVPVSQECEYDPLFSPRWWKPFRIISTWYFKDPGYFRLGMNFRTKLKRLLRVERVQSVEYQHIQNLYHQERGFIELTYFGNARDRVFRYFQRLVRDSSGMLLDLQGEIEGDGIKYEFTIAWIHSMSCNLIDYRQCWHRTNYWYMVRFYIHEDLKQIWNQ